MATIEEKMNNLSTSTQVAGGTPVSGGPGDRVEIEKARRQIYDTLASNAFSFEDFNAELDDPEFGEQILEKLSKSKKLSGWDLESLRAAVFEGKLNEVSSEGSEVTSETLPEPLESSPSSNLQTVKLSPEEESRFSEWYSQVAQYKGLDPNPDNPQHLYDYRAFFKAEPELANSLLTEDPEAHFTDIGKLPGHPTFSNESLYFNRETSSQAGEWIEGVYIPFDKNREAFNEVTGEFFENPRANGTYIPPVQVQGTWREGFDGTFNYDAEGYENFVPTPEFVESMGGWERLKQNFQEQHPNVLLHKPLDPNAPQVEAFDPSEIVNYDVARPNDIAAIRKQQELSVKPFEEWSEEDRADYFFSNIVANNIQQGNSVTEASLEEARVRQVAEQDDADSTGFLGSLRDLASSGFRAFGSGSARLASDVLGTVPFLNDVIANIIGTPSFRETYGQTFIQDAQDVLKGAISRDELYNRIRFGEEGVVDAFTSGNIEGGVNKLVSGITNSLPIMLSLSSGNVAGLTSTLSMGAGQYESLQSENPEMDQSMKLLNSTLNMYAEMIPEKIGADAVFKPFYDLYRKSGRQVAEQAFSKFLRKYTGQFSALSPTAVEGITEVATTGLQNIIAKYSGEDPNRKLNAGMADAFVIGGAAGGIIASPAQIAGSVVNRANRAEAQRLATENSDIEAVLSNSGLNPQVREALTEKYLNNVSAINNYIEQEIDRKGSLSSAQRAIVEDLEARKERMSSLIENPSVPESVQEGAQQDLEVINDQIEAILNENTKENSETPVEDADVAPVETEVATTEELVESTTEGVDEGVSEGVQQNETITETEQSEMVDTEVSSELSTPTFFESLVDSDQRATRLQALEERLRSNIQSDQNLGVNQDNRERARKELEFVRDLTEYAVLKVADGTVKTAEAFQNLAKGLGDFSTDVLNRAYYTAQDIANNYLQTNPDRESLDQATGEVLQRLQDVTIDRTKPTTKVTSKTVREITDGGTQGTIVQSVKKAQQEYYKTLEKGAKIGAKATRDAGRKLQNDVKKSISEAFKAAGVRVSTVMSNRDLTRLANKVASVRNERTLQDANDFVGRLVEKAEYARTFNDLLKLRDLARRRARSERLPANVREVFGNFSGLASRDLFTKGILTPANMAEAQAIVDAIQYLNAAIKPGASDRGGISYLEELNTKIKDFSDKVERMNFRQELPDLVEHLKSLSTAAGTKWNDSDTPGNYREYRLAVDALETAIQEQNPTETKSKSATRQNAEESISRALPLLDSVDLAEYTQNEQKVIQDMKQITPEILEELGDADVIKLSIALPNLINNGRLDGIGSAVAKANAYRLAADTEFTTSVRKAINKVPALASLISSVPGLSAKHYDRIVASLMSSSQRIDALFKDLFTKGKFISKFGIQGYKEGRNTAQRLYEKAQKDFGELATSDSDVRSFLRSKDRGQREIKLGIFAWLNQHESGLTQEEQQALFERKIATLEKMRQGIDPASGDKFDWREMFDNKAYYENVRAALSEMVQTSSIEDARSKLGKGEIKVYEQSLKMFESLRPEFIANARLYNNVDLDTSVDNYTPIDYKFFSDDANSALLDTSYDRAFSSAKISGRSGSKSAKDRIIKDGTLPRDGILDFNFISNVFKNYGLQLADIHTQGERMQIHHNLMNSKLKASVEGVNFFYTINNMMTEEMQTSYNYYSTPRIMKLSNKLMRNLMTSTYGKALGGVGQAVKQFVPMILDAMARTGDVKTLAWYWGNSGKVAEFMSKQDIARRGVRSSQMGSSVTNDLDVGELNNKVLRSIDSALEAHENFVNKVVLGPLRMGDVHGARISWMMYYNQYAEQHGLKVDLDSSPNPEAAAYADNMVDLTGNTSVDANKAKFTQSIWAKMFFPFSGTALVSLMNQAVNTSKLYTAIQTKDGVAARQALNALAANSVAIISFQMVGWGLRWASYMGLKSLVSMAINSVDLDDEDEEGKLVQNLNVVLDDYVKKREQRNLENSTYYITNDLIHRGLLSQGPMEAFSNAIIKPTFEDVTGFTVNSYKSANPREAMYELAGIYGIIPAGIDALLKKNSSLFKDEEGQMRDNGYGAFMKADGTYGFELPEGKSMPKKLRVFQKAMNVLSIPASFGIQDQSVSSITRTMPALYKQMEKVVYKDVPKVSDVTNDKQFQNKFKSLNYQGRTMKLESAEEKLFKKAYKDAYDEEYKGYIERNEPLFGKGKKIEELAMKHIYKKAKEKLMSNKDFKQIWDLRSDKSK